MTFERGAACGVLLEDACDERPPHRIHLDAVRQSVIDVTDVRDAREVPLFGLLAQPFLDLFAQVVDVVLGHQHLDAVEELVGRAGGGRRDRAFLDEVHLDAEFVNRDPVLDVAVEPIRLLHEDRPARRMILHERQHLAEAATAGLPRRFNVHKFAKDGQVLHLRIVAEQFLLGRDREALSFLILRRDRA